ncbi:hypothetical protein E5198_19990 [Pseudomonas sp. A-1]|nr:hypothetical protein E5198_19990 [Pseudomonas sp. A-1]
MHCSLLVIAPTLRVGVPYRTLRVCFCDAERHWLRSHAERGNDQDRPSRCLSFRSANCLRPLSQTRHPAIFPTTLLQLNPL